MNKNPDEKTPEQNRAAKEWSRKNEQEKAPMNPNVVRDVKESKERNPAPPAIDGDSAASKETFSKRTERPGETGLANEARPGLGTRMETKGKPDAKKGGEYKKPRPEPQEQNADSRAQQEERSTGVSGHSSGS